MSNKVANRIMMGLAVVIVSALALLWSSIP